MLQEDTGYAPLLDANRVSSMSPAYTLQPSPGEMSCANATPMVAIKLRLLDANWVTLYLKMEGSIQGRSIKDRTAASLLADVLFRSGKATKDAVLVESSSGNLALALARLSCLMGIEFVAVVDDRLTSDLRRDLLAAGATVEVVKSENSDWLGARLDRVQKICASSDVAIWTNQYANPANPHAHFLTTGPEILHQAGGKLAHVLLAVSTCGTLAGLGSFLRLTSPNTRITAVDVQGSTIFGGNPGHRLLTGIGASRRPSFNINGLYDRAIHIDDGEAMSVCHALRSVCGLSVGGSTGAVVAAARRLSQAEASQGPVVCISADNGSNYESTIFRDAWLRKNSIVIDRTLCNVFGTV